MKEEVDVLAALRARPDAAAVLDALAGRKDVWVVGGAVRDALLGRPARDLDLVVEGDALTVARAVGEVLEIHDRFGTVEARCGTLNVGFARARVEVYAAPGALPEVTFATLEEDLARRDFTVNAVACGLDGAVRGFGTWREDLAARRLRVLHPGSFADDPTRLWRAARYAARLGLAVEEETLRLARDAVAGGALGTVSGPRLGSELLLALGEPDPAAALTAAYELGLLPEGAHPRRTVVRAALALLPEDGDAGIVALAAMCGGVGAARLRGWLDHLGVPARERDVIVAAVDGADALSRRLTTAARPSEVAAAVGGRTVEEVALAGAIAGGGPSSDGISAQSRPTPAGMAGAWLGELRHVRLDITGADLLDAGVSAGPEVGERLRRALAAKLDGDAPGRAEQLAVALGA